MLRCDEFLFNYFWYYCLRIVSANFLIWDWSSALVSLIAPPLELLFDCFEWYE